jgi:NifU-like protein involved in Fe-S cluster formation
MLDFGGRKMSRKLAQEELKLLGESGYSKKAIELYVNKVNVGELENPDVVTTYRGPCGDLIKLHLRIGRNSIIKDAKFYYAGCPSVAASASAMIEFVKGKTIDKAKKITEDDVLNELGGLPKTKLDCPKLAITTLRKAIAEYEKTKGRSEI